ncbi:MAG: VIT1/CCC1 transporter family protein [Candidatus Blackburnbacteria bacterium]|nr:VIT1/CCC1 transporter family protein [Candidatus Blackburnbacteria bacterium]
MNLRLHPDYVRAIMFGAEDALISTTGSIIGLSVGVETRNLIIMAALVYITVEGVSMAAGQFLSERTVHEMDKRKHTDNLYMGSGVMFLSYFLASMIPLAPFLVLPVKPAAFSAIVSALLFLFTLGYVKGKALSISSTRSGLEMLFVGGLAASIGVLVGFFLRAV